MTKPVDFAVEGLLAEDSRGDTAAIDLFVAGVRDWAIELRGIVGQNPTAQRSARA